MVTKVRKWFWVWDEDKERAFLEEMASKGLRLTEVGFGEYIFEESTPQDLVYQFDFKGIDKMKEGEYLQLYEDAGWHFMSRFGRWYYFARERDEEETDMSLFNDHASQRAKFRRLLIFLIIVGIPLYYQNIFMFPNMVAGEFSFPSFYFFFRIFSLILIGLHIAAVVKIILMYRKLKSYISE